ncbi:MAG: transcriptional regulator GcvA [Magnetovibrionaceae bacterium]
MSRLPPLNALRAFEAGARHLSFTRAAEELNVTPAAVSHQVKLLEDDLGKPLFQRLTRRLALTDDGRRLLPVVSDALSRIGDVVDDIRKPTGLSLTITTTASLGSRWLAPRIGAFMADHPDLDVKLHHSFTSVDFTRPTDVDVALRWGKGHWKNCEAVYLMAATMTPVCSPKLLESGPPLKKPEDLAHHQLIHERDYTYWTEWLKGVGVEGVEPRRGLTTNEPSVIDQAVIAGQGVAMGREDVMARHLAEGILVKPFDLSVDDFAYWIVYPDNTAEGGVVSQFRDWVLREAKKDQRAARSEGRSAMSPNT